LDVIWLRAAAMVMFALAISLLRDGIAAVV
jgi:hypothetical protein